jgi:superfamily II DNA/RNA helicase
VETQYNKALSKEKQRNIAFALVILQRRLASSTYALFKSLERRRDKLEKFRELSESSYKPKIKAFDFEDVEELSEEERWREEELWETLSVAENKEELIKEINTIKSLIEKSKDVLNKEEEIKLKQLKDTLNDLNNKYPNEKVIIFTESKDTLEYIEKKVRFWGYSVNTIHGGLTLEQRIEAEAIFKNEKQILIATEAAGEGINLQFCNLMINYDIPWNPNRLEQRMGRIHRYGQQKEVFIHNLVAEDTREGEVLVRIFEKLEEIKRNLGSDKVFDVIGEVFFGKNLQQIIMEAASGAKTREEILKDIDIKVDEAYIKRVKEDLGESLATRHIDYTRIKEMADKAREYKLIPEYTESFFKKAFKLSGGKYRQRKDGFTAIDSIPYEIKIIADEDKFKRAFGPLIKKYPKVTFDKDKAFANTDSELISFGHPLFEGMLEYVEDKYSENLKRGAVFVDPEGKMNGYILFYEGEIKDGTSEPNTVGKRFFAIYKDQHGSNPIPPSVLWDLSKSEGIEEIIDLSEIETEIITQVISQMEGYKKEKMEERDREAKIKQKYGIKSLEDLILRLDRDVIKLIEREENGENVRLLLGNKKRDLKKYIASLEELKDQIERERTLTMGMPKFVGIIRVKAAKIVPEPMRSSAEIEKIGMEESFKYEKMNGRYPEDVSAENIGFDIRSIDPNGPIRYIEVKARAKVGDIALTQNEQFKASRLGDNYYLYVVYDAATNPNLLIIKNPAENLEMEKRPEVVRYYIKSKHINEKGVKNG